MIFSSIRKRPFLLAILLSFSIFHNVQAQEPQIVPEKLSDQLYVLYGGNGQGSNVGMLITDDGILLIDAMLSKSGEKLLRVIREISDKPIRYVLNTHEDSDHAGGNAMFAEMGATIISQQNCRYSSALTQVTFKDELTLTFGDELVKMWHTPSHAHSDMTIYLEKENALFLGDTFTNTWHPTFYSGGMEGQYAVLDLAEQLSDNNTAVVPGHGFVSNKAGLGTYRNGCEAWQARMSTLVSQNKSLEEMLVDKKLLELRKQFVERNGRGTMPDMNFQRLIQRTISTDFTETYSVEENQLRSYTGHYRPEEGEIMQIIVREAKLFLAVEGSTLSELIPVSADRFHLRATIDRYIRFDSDNNGDINRLVYERPDNESIARRIKP